MSKYLRKLPRLAQTADEPLTGLKPEPAKIEFTIAAKDLNSADFKKLLLSEKVDVTTADIQGNAYGDKTAIHFSMVAEGRLVRSVCDALQRAQQKIKGGEVILPISISNP